jgi:hydrogenase maturation protease
VVVDAASSDTAAPGTVHRFDALRQPLPASVLASSTQTIGVPAAVELGRALGRLPRSLRG